MPDPILQKSANEIADILKKHDIAGFAVLGGQKHTHYLHNLETTWNCLRFHGPRNELLHLRCKREDFATAEEQMQCLERTVGVLQGFVDVAHIESAKLQSLLVMVGRHVEIQHVSIEETKQAAPAPTKDSADLIMAGLLELARLERATTQGEWHIREVGDEQLFVERARVEGEPYGVEILGDDGYKTKRGDAEFIVAAKKLVMTLSKVLNL